MIPGNKDFMLIGQSAKPMEKVGYFLLATAKGEIAGMNDDIRIGQMQGLMLAVGIGYVE
jgi:hypothetical protein